MKLIDKVSPPPGDLTQEEFETFYIKYSYKQLEFLRDSYIKDSKNWMRFNNLILKKGSESLHEESQ